ncbi:LamG-like jellyroll fold domain-containing protein [Paenibacillus sp. Soil787]|uniref:LamG-like jellyroll fold domain-containing protein n=1 Tax=Paenibacillus sp. Soil787 TaxID=1736411 RepID=UPI000703A047|nr:LamG-like jellyroll fold domain-containing protein [Paenibacillus sp. Soil787]KRF09938.1 hypothetical protein ASG93_19105 [Paenibacillus sp. Soil787]
MKRRARLLLLSASLLQFGIPMSFNIAQADQSPDPLRIVKNYTGVFTTKPTVFNNHTMDAPLLGNGDVGVAIGGGIDQMTFYAGKNEFWSRSQKRPLPLGRISLSIPGMTGASYNMEQDIANAEVRGNFTLNENTINTTSWISATDNLLITKLSYSGTSSTTATVALKDGFGNTLSANTTATNDVLSLDLQADPITVNTKIGREDYGSGRYYFNGNIDDLRIYNRALTDTEVTQLYNLQSVSSGLTTQYTFDSIPPGAVNTSSVAGKIGNALAFNGTSSYWDAGNLTIDPGAPKSLGTWIYVPSFSSDANFILAQGEWNKNTSLGLSNGKLRFQTAYGNYLDSDSVVPKNQWVHAMGTFDGQYIKLYINGSLVKTSTSAIVSNPIPLVLMSSRIVGTTGTISNGQLSFTMQPGQTYTLATSLISNTDSTDYLNASVSKVSTLTQANVDSINQNHRSWWTDFWTKSFVEIPDKTIEKSYYGSLYLLGSSMRGNEYAPALFGPWLTQVMAWDGTFFLNYNYETPYYGLYPTNHIDLTDNYDQPILDWIPKGQAAAASNSFSGVYYPVAIGPLPEGSPAVAIFHNQKSNASYAAVNMIMRYNYTKDTVYANKVYNYLKLVGDFWSNYMTWDGSRYVIANDAQREGDAYPQTNGVISLGFVRTLYQGLINISTDLNQDESLRSGWQDKLDHISNFSTQTRNGQTVFRTTEVGRDWSSNNSVEIQHIFPGGQIGLSSDATMLQTAKDTVGQMQRWSDDNGTPAFYTAAARVGYDPATILTQLNSWITNHSYKNMHIYSYGGGIENLATVPSAVNEMLLQSHQNKIRVFADWPANTYAKFQDFRAYGGFLVSSHIDNNTVQYLRIISEKGKPATFINPWPGQTLAIYRNGVTSGTLSGNEVTITTSPNETIHIATNGTTYSEILDRMTTPAGKENVALNKSVTDFSSQYDTTTWKAANMNDGVVNSTSRGWASKSGSGTRDEWVTIDLGQTYNLSSFTIQNEDVSDNRNVKDYKLYGSSTGAFGDEKFEISSGTIPSLLHMATHTVNFTPVNARYVKFVGTSSYSNYVIVGELSLYGN